MPRGLSNWTYKDVCKFLKFYGFEFGTFLEGSHESWYHPAKEAVVEVNRTKGSYPELTLLTMIRQSNMDRKIWRDWAHGKKHPKMGR